MNVMKCKMCVQVPRPVASGLSGVSVEDVEDWYDVCHEVLDSVVEVSVISGVAMHIWSQCMSA